MNLGEFKDLVRAQAKRGSAIDPQLDGFIRRAARWVEQNYTFQYMRTRATLTATTGLDAIALPQGTPIKGLSSVRFNWTRGFLDVAKVDLDVLEAAEIWDRYPTSAPVFPTQFALNGGDELLFNAKFPEDCVGVLTLVRYSTWPKGDDQTHWLLQNAEALLLTQTMIEFMVDQRNDQGYAAVRSHRDEAVRALINADFETRYSSQDIYFNR